MILQYSSVVIIISPKRMKKVSSKQKVIFEMLLKCVLKRSNYVLIPPHIQLQFQRYESLLKTMCQKLN